MTDSSNRASYKTLAELHKDFPWKTPEKFIPLARRYGFTNANEVRQFLKGIVHDKKPVKPVWLPVFSTSGDSYQFDILVQQSLPPFLIIINNTRKAYAYPLKNKKASEVCRALSEFFNDVKNVKVMVSDSDSAFLSNDVLRLLQNHKVSYRTTEDSNHHVLGIINRFMRTIRDLNSERDFTVDKMKQIIALDNKSPHRSLGNKAPDDMTKEDEDLYIARKQEETRSIKLPEYKPGERVRLLLDKERIGKHRMTYTDKSYIIDGKSGNQWIVRAKDGSVDKIPSHKLIRAGSNVPLADSLKQGKRGVVEKILSYDNRHDKYKVLFDEGTIDGIPAKNLREGNPLRLSIIEKQFWYGKDLPPKIKLVCNY